MQRCDDSTISSPSRSRPRSLSGRLFAVGGSNIEGSGEVLKTTELYNFSTQKWTYGPSMLERRQQADAALIGDKVYVIGGERKRT